MKKIVIIVPYFGNLPENFNVFMNSCGRNENIDFIFISDNDLQIEFENISFWKMSFPEFRSIVQQAFDFPIALESPYKLCDYKPTYGKVLQNWIKDYDFWGYCDVDLIFGRIDHFVTEDVLQRYDQIYQYGHFMLYRNNELNNDRFMSDEGLNYKKVFTSNRIYFFDEKIMPSKFDLLKVPRYKERDFIDIDPWKFRMIDVCENDANRKAKTTLFEWENGNLFKCTYHKKTGMITKEEYLYIHFQKRKMVDNTQDATHILITNKGLLPCYDGLKEEHFLQLDNNNIFQDMNKHFNKQKFILNRRIKRYILK
ncbi:DUF6625 family protein [Listeria aquatica]|uniref:Uncharacterized protein n=2 Tax=Listeria aquatica TaxID=1494960 RepID=A0A841ZRC3_9LIST|nr:DUF6625 family protein [Listeria aquatica]MBC1521705.1 hypothetical protein [Listeria aquatica]